MVEKIERFNNEEGRRVEKRIFEENGERIIETHIEAIPMHLHERITEKLASLVTSRKKEVFKDGQLVDVIIEELDKPLKMATPDTVITKDNLTETIIKPKKTLKMSLDNTTYLEYLELGLYAIISCEMAFCLYHLILTNWF